MMEKVIVAFEGDKSCRRVREILEPGGAASCIVCRSAAEGRRTANKQRGTVVVCGYKFPDGSAEELLADLPPSCAMLMVADQSMPDLGGSDDIFQLAAPGRREDRTASVRMRLQMGRRLERFSRPHRSGEERALVEQAKALLMDRNEMTEEQAHRFLQKKSMNSGVKLAETARMVLDSL